MSSQNAHGLSSIAIKVWLEIKSIISSNVTLKGSPVLVYIKNSLFRLLLPIETIVCAPLFGS